MAKRPATGKRRAGAGRTGPGRPAARPDGDRAQARRQVPLLEWIVAALGAALVAATIGYLTLSATTRDETPPDVRVDALEMRAVQDGFLVAFRATNDGTQPAAQLVIEGELGPEDGPLETSEATVDYLPAHARREGGLYFRHDPRDHPLRLRAKGYVNP